MAESLAELRALSDDEVVRKYDDQSSRTVVGLNYWMDELNRRYQQRQTDSMLRLTKWITSMTVIVTVATLVNVGIAISERGWSDLDNGDLIEKAEQER